MITTVIGRVFLEAFNESYQTSYNAKTFFTDVFYPLFFGHPKYLIWAINSPFVQDGYKPEKWTDEDGKERLKKFIDKVERGAKDASVAMGYAASDKEEYQRTSGQKTNMEINITSEDVYLSWFGYALGICVEGDVTILFNHKKILMDIYEGWKLYRVILDSNLPMKGNQCNTWNATWLSHRYSRNYIPDKPMSNFSPVGEGMKIRMSTWINVLLGVSSKYKDSKLLGYLYNFGQTNSTYGFIPFLLDEIRRPKDLYRKYFNSDSDSASSLYGTAHGLVHCCQQGVLGLKAMEPKDLEPYFRGEKLPKLDMKDDDKMILFRTYQIWILAMLNNQDYWDKSLKLAENLKEYVLSDKTLSTKRTNSVSAILKTTSKKVFIEALTVIVSDSSNKEPFIEIAHEVNGMPSDNVPYFLTLVRFQYASIQ